MNEKDDLINFVFENFQYSLDGDLHKVEGNLVISTIFNYINYLLEKRGLESIAGYLITVEKFLNKGINYNAK